MECLPSNSQGLLYLHCWGWILQCRCVTLHTFSASQSWQPVQTLLFLEYVKWHASSLPHKKVSDLLAAGIAPKACIRDQSCCVCLAWLVGSAFHSFRTSEVSNEHVLRAQNFQASEGLTPPSKPSSRTSSRPGSAASSKTQTSKAAGPPKGSNDRKPFNGATGPSKPISSFTQPGWSPILLISLKAISEMASKQFGQGLLQKYAIQELRPRPGMKRLGSESSFCRYRYQRKE